MRLIDADRLIEDMSASALPIMVKGISEITGDESCIADHINNAPTIDIIDTVPVVHARLQETGFSEVFCSWGNCTNCGTSNILGSKYCNECGARLDGDPHDSGQ